MQIHAHINSLSFLNNGTIHHWTSDTDHFRNAPFHSGFLSNDKACFLKNFSQVIIALKTNNNPPV